MIAKVGERNLPAAKGVGKTKYPLNFVSFRTLYSAGQAGGGPKLSQRYLAVSERKPDFGGKQNLKEITRIQLKS